MKTPRTASITRKLTVLIMVAVGAAMLLSYTAFVANDVRIMRSSMVRQLSALADVLGSNTAAALTFDDADSASQLLSSLKLQPSVESACIYDATGNVFATFSADGSVASFPDIPKQAGHEFTPGGYLDVSERITANNEQIGSIYFHANLDVIRREIASYAMIVGLAMIASFVAAYLLASRLQRGISGPILALAKTAERISAEEDYSIRVHKSSNDELGILYDQFNRMLEQVESGKRDLQDAHKRLQLQSQEKMRAIVETAADAIITFNVDGGIESCNGASSDLFGLSVDNLTGNTLADLLVEAQGAPWNEFLHGLLDTGRSRKKGSTELHVLRHDGTRVPLLLSLSEFGTDGGRMFTAILRDLSDYKKLQQELLQAHRLESIGELAAGIAHEINTPMQFINDNVEFLKECVEKLFTVVDALQSNLDMSAPKKSWQERCDEVGDMIRQNRFDRIRTEIPKAIEESLEGIDRVIRIVRAMKECSHPGHEEKVGLDLNNAVRSTVTISRNRWKYSAEIELDLDPDLPTLRCVPGEINQVLLNLIVNAADAIADKVGASGEQKGTITVRTRRNQDQITVEVADTGCGIPDKIRNRVFDPFFTTKAVGKGTGQGLAICYNIVVNKHQGTLDFESTPGQGTLFRVTFPPVPRECGDSAPEPDAEPAALASVGA